MIRTRDNSNQRRGTAAVAVLVVLLLIGLFVVGIVNTGARDQDISARRMETVQAFYAAEAGINMAVRELVMNLDEDNDGTIGSISDDANAANDPSFNNGRAYTTRADDTSIVLTCEGRAGNARRTIEAAFN